MWVANGAGNVELEDKRNSLQKESFCLSSMQTPGDNRSINCPSFCLLALN